MKSRPNNTFRASRRNLAKAHGLVWRALPNSSMGFRDSRANRTLTVQLPPHAWALPPPKVKAPRWLRRFNQTGRLARYP